jgi:hypothetical protein
MINVSDKGCRKNKKILCSIILFSVYGAVFEIMWKNMVQPDRPQMTI